MTGSDDEFEEFLKRRKPVFRSPDDMFEPPAELDRVVLRQAREAIEGNRPLRVFRGPRWAAPVAIAATLVLAFAVLFQAGIPANQAPVPEVTVQNVSERVEIAQPAPAVASASPAVTNNPVREHAASDAIVVDLATPADRRDSAAGETLAKNAPALVSREEADRHAAPPPPTAPVVAGRAPESTAMSASSTEVPMWRRDPQTWKAEIERLRNAGETARADAELAEFNRQQRAYAVGPDR
jgi:hypothetical protein